MEILQTKKWQRIAASAVIAFVLLLLLEVFPRLAGIADKTFMVIRQQSDVQTAQASINSYRQLMLANKELRQQIQQLTRNSSGGGRSLADILSAIEKAAQSSGVRIISITPRQVQNKDHLLLQPVELSVQADYESTYQFIAAIEAQEPVTLVKQISIVPVLLFSGDVETTISVQICLNL